ncbi:MAG TPA: hypothetical protein VD908_18380 [Cytophagales bacterium]|nr:hypothetical protein [Cytophagales bacterium]
MKTYTNTFMALLMTIAIAFYSCEQIDDIVKNDTENPVDSSETVVGKVTEIGSPAGIAESTIIGDSVLIINRFW